MSEKYVCTGGTVLSFRFEDSLSVMSLIRLSCTMQITQLPLRAMGGLYHNFDRAGNGPHSYYVGNYIEAHAET